MYTQALVARCVRSEPTKILRNYIKRQINGAGSQICVTFSFLLASLSLNIQSHSLPFGKFRLFTTFYGVRISLQCTGTMIYIIYLKATIKLHISIHGKHF